MDKWHFILTTLAKINHQIWVFNGETNCQLGKHQKKNGDYDKRPELFFQLLLVRNWTTIMFQLKRNWDHLSIEWFWLLWFYFFMFIIYLVKISKKMMNYGQCFPVMNNFFCCQNYFGKWPQCNNCSILLFFFTITIIIIIILF